MATKKYRLGRLTKAEETIIRDMALTSSVEAIAAKISRKPASVQEWIDANIPKEEIKAATEKAVTKIGLKDSAAWKQLKNKMTSDELFYFEEKYLELMEQFRDEATATERTQMMFAVELEVLMDRNMQARRRALNDIERIEKDMVAFRKKVTSIDDWSEADKNWMMSMETNLQAAKAGEQSKTKEYVDLQDRHQKLMHALKATRDQRISRVADSKQSFLGLIKALQEEDVRERKAKQSELMRLATDEEYKKLSKPHKYLDGNQDQPILSADTIDLLEENNE